MRVHVIGNAVFDEALAVEEWPTPGASILCRPRASGPGGKGLNQAVALARAGMAARLVAGVGEDARAAAIRAALAGEPLALRLVVLPGRATDTSIVLSARDGDNCNITTAECAGALTPETVRAAVREAAVGDAVLVQGNLSEAATRAALEAADAGGMVRVMNPSPLRPWQAGLLAACGAIFVNAAEAAARTGRDAVEAARALHDMGIAEVVVTRGAAGAFVSGPAGVAEVPAEPVAVRDTTGAGDAFLGATLASALLRRSAIDAVALRAGAKAAAIAVSRAGAFAALPTGAELAGIMRR
jgi:ribokinase